jgi:CBS-domain-containing membrane protein
MGHGPWMCWWCASRFRARHDPLPLATLKGRAHHQEEEPQHMKAEDVMTTKVITVTEQQSKQQAARLLSQYRMSGLPIANDDNMVVGAVTDYDVMSKEG